MFPHLPPSFHPLHVSGSFDSFTEAERIEEMTRCHRKENFYQVHRDFRAERYMFVRADMNDYVNEKFNANWFPHRMQLQLKYWQKRDSGTVYKKRLVKGNLILADYMRPPSGSVRGYEYDLRITFIPVPWIDVLNQFALQPPTYLIFYVVVDFVLIIIVMVIWGLFRLGVRSSNPPRLNFTAWLKGFEFNPVIGFTVAAVPIIIVAAFLKSVMVYYDPLKVCKHSLKYLPTRLLR